MFMKIKVCELILHGPPNIKERTCKLAQNDLFKLENFSFNRLTVSSAP